MTNLSLCFLLVNFIITTCDDSQSDDKRKFGLTSSERHTLLNSHRKFRSEVKPPAADMTFLEWDDDLAEIAYKWSKLCKDEHGMLESKLGLVGQNLYWGPNRTITKAVHVWHFEKKDYSYKWNNCTDDRVCGHYTAIVWADVKKVGCGVHNCKSNLAMLTCNYYPVNNVNNHRPYLDGKPCTKCHGNQGWCYRNSCINKKTCEKYGLSCKCGLTCLNCGVLDEDNCNCECQLGWDYSDCSGQCENINKKCAKNPGWFDTGFCDQNKRIKLKYCRKFCGLCEEVDFSRPDDLCCDGKTCEKEEALNSKCDCVSLKMARKEAEVLKHNGIGWDKNETGNKDRKKNAAISISCQIRYILLTAITISLTSTLC